MSNTKFKKDLKFGNDGEKVVFNHLTTLKEGVKLVEECNNADYDFKIKVDGAFKTYEVKTEDSYCKPGNDTGNIFIEIECSGKSSGLNRSVSDWYVFYLFHYGEVWYIKKDDLKILLIENNIRKVGNSGDGGRVVGYLLPRDEYRHHFMIYKV